MDNTIISLRIDKELRERMRNYDEVNWSAVLRKAIIENLKNKEKIDLERRKKAAKMMDKIRVSGVFGGGKDSVSIIREWRDKRK